MIPKVGTGRVRITTIQPLPGCPRWSRASASLRFANQKSRAGRVH